MVFFEGTPTEGEKVFKKTYKKLLTNAKGYGILNWLSRERQQRTLKTEQYVKP